MELPITSYGYPIELREEIFLLREHIVPEATISYTIIKKSLEQDAT